MRQRGSHYWDWADCQLNSRCHEETLGNGCTIDVQVRLSRQGVTQAFIGVYASDGRMLLEEYHDTRESETLTQAMHACVAWARTLGSGQASAGPWSLASLHQAL
ncbi:hypothetical protein D9M71_269070 [compost metagenome]